MHDSIAIVLIKVFTVCTRLDRNTRLLCVTLSHSKRSLMQTLPAFACLCVLMLFYNATQTFFMLLSLIIDH